ncbi:MAG: dephospho-CoA kinase [Gammaproteobacteria bacterium]|nr:dephospho-CoA kinase [Gammaproteobacteria bacterium]
MLKVGMTGGIGSGKSTVARIFETLGTPVVDTDDLARSLRQPGQPGYKAIIKYFGQDCLNSDGSLNRHWLRERIMHSDSDKTALEAILHPLIFDALEIWYSQQSCTYAIAVVPLMHETSSADRFDRILVIDCPKSVQIQRIVKRDLINQHDAELMVSRQTSRENRLKLADDAIINTSESTTDLEQDVKKLHNLYLSLATMQG